MKVFDAYRIDPVNRCVWHGERLVKMTPKAFDVLHYLVDRPGRLVTHEEILEALWPRSYVNQEVVKKYILSIRNALGDRRDEATFIETIPRRGYRFVAPIRDEIPAATVHAAATGLIVGREAASSRLQALLDAAMKGRRQVVFVTGEAGIGKTTLVDLFQQHAASIAGVRVGRGQCVEGFGGKEPYYPLLEALGRLTREGKDAALVQALEARAPTWLVQLPSALGPGDRDAIRARIVGATRERMVRELCDAVDELTASAPLILIVEDLQWADPSTLDVISALARRREPARLALVATMRSPDAALSGTPLPGLLRDLRLHGLCEEIELAALQVPDVGRYLGTILGVQVPPGVVESVHRHSDGNPLFMAAIVEELRAKKWSAESADGGALGVPVTLQRMLEMHFDELDEKQQRLLVAAAAYGERFHTSVVSAVAGLAVDEAEALCEALAARRRFVRSAGIEELSTGRLSACYEFTHALRREAIYRRTSEVARARLHRGIAQELQRLAGDDEQARRLAPDLARHFELGHDPAQAIRYLVASAEVAASRFAYHEATAMLARALEFFDRLGGGEVALPESRIHVLIGDAQYTLGAMAESTRAYEMAAASAARAGDRAGQVAAFISLVRPLGLIDPDRGIAAVDAAVRVGATLDDPLLQARTQRLAASVRLVYDAWRPEDAAVCAAAHEAILELSGEEAPSFDRMLYAHVLALEGRYASAQEIFEETSNTSRLGVDAIVHFFALSGRTVTLLRTGRLGEVLDIVRHGKEVAERNSNDPWLFKFREAWLRTLVMDHAGALEVCDSMLESGGAYPMEQPQAIARVAHGYSRLGAGKVDEAIAAFAQGADPPLPRKFFLHWIWRLTAQLGLCDAWLAKGDLGEAARAGEALLAAALAAEDPYLRALAHETNARIAMARDDTATAGAHLDAALSLVSAYDIPGAAWRAHATAREWFIRSKDDAQALAHLDKARSHARFIADSFERDEPLRRSFLESAAVRALGLAPA